MKHNSKKNKTEGSPIIVIYDNVTSHPVIRHGSQILRH